MDVSTSQPGRVNSKRQKSPSSLRTLTQHFVLGFYEADVVKPHRKKGLFECF
jgi:hypothetical protein